MESRTRDRRISHSLSIGLQIAASPSPDRWESEAIWGPNRHTHFLSITQVSMPSFFSCSCISQNQLTESAWIP